MHCSWLGFCFYTLLSTFLIYFETFLALHLYNKYITTIFTSSNKENEKTRIMPIELLHTDSEILKIRTQLLKKASLNNEELSLLKEINEYCNRPV